MQSQNRFKTFYKEHKKVAFLLLAGLLIIIAIIVVIFTTQNDNDGVPGTDSRTIEASTAEDQKALSNFKIASYLPITSKDPAYTISYLLDKTDNNYSLKLVLNAFAASARDDMIRRLLEENFGGEDPLKYEIILENYYNPFTNYSLENIADNQLPPNFTKGSLYKFGDSKYTVQTFIHTLYDGSKNTYRAVLENGELKTKPQLFFTYAELPFFDEAQVRSLNNLE